jgi:hypothetical protein
MRINKFLIILKVFYYKEKNQNKVAKKQYKAKLLNNKFIQQKI